MDYWRDDNHYNYLLELLESPYAVVNYLSWQARTLCECYQDKILHSEALYWVYTGSVPSSLTSSRVIHTELDNLLTTADATLIYIYDREVVECVKRSLIDSYNANHLIYNYIHIDDPNRQARVRILVRMFWLNNLGG